MVVAMGCDAGGAGTGVDAGADVGRDVVAIVGRDAASGSDIERLDAPTIDAASCLPDASALATVNGTVYNTLDGGTLADVTVSVEDGCAQLARRTAVNGGYGLRLPVGETVFLRAESDDVMPQLRGVFVPAVNSTQDFYVLTRTFFRLAAASARITPDPAKGHVWVSFENARYAGYGASLSLPWRASLTRAPDGEALVSSMTTLAPGLGHWFLVFANVDVGTTTITLTTPEGRRCTPRQPMVTEWIVRAGAITYYEADCD